MLSNPPYAKSWKKDSKAMGGKENTRLEADVVTGKLDVPAAIRQLLESAPEAADALVQTPADEESEEASAQE